MILKNGDVKQGSKFDWIWAIFFKKFWERMLWSVYDLGGLVPRTSAKSSFFKVLKMKFLVDPGEEDEPLLSCSLFHIVSIDPILPLIFI